MRDVAREPAPTMDGDRLPHVARAVYALNLAPTWVRCRGRTCPAHLGGCVAGGISKVQLARHDVVDIAPDPGLAWFNGADQWMFRRVEVPGGVLVLG
jgi:hypothetical protein